MRVYITGLSPPRIEVDGDRLHIAIRPSASGVQNAQQIVGPLRERLGFGRLELLCFELLTLPTVLPPSPAVTAVLSWLAGKVKRSGLKPTPRGVLFPSNTEPLVLIPGNAIVSSAYVNWLAKTLGVSPSEVGRGSIVVPQPLPGAEAPSDAATGAAEADNSPLGAETTTESAPDPAVPPSEGV